MIFLRISIFVNLDIEVAHKKIRDARELEHPKKRDGKEVFVGLVQGLVVVGTRDPVQRGHEKELVALTSRNADFEPASSSRQSAQIVISIVARDVHGHHGVRSTDGNAAPSLALFFAEASLMSEADIFVERRA